MIAKEYSILFNDVPVYWDLMYVGRYEYDKVPLWDKSSKEYSYLLREMKAEAVKVRKNDYYFEDGSIVRLRETMILIGQRK